MLGKLRIGERVRQFKLYLINVRIFYKAADKFQNFLLNFDEKW